MSASCPLYPQKRTLDRTTIHQPVPSRSWRGARKKLDAARISASVIFGSNEQRILYNSASISLNSSASFSMSDTVYVWFSGDTSGCSHRTPPRTSTVFVRLLKHHHVKLRCLHKSTALFKTFLISSVCGWPPPRCLRIKTIIFAVPLSDAVH